MILGLSLTHLYVNRGASVRNVAQIWLRRSTKGTSGRCVRMWVLVWYIAKSTVASIGLEKNSHLRPEVQAWRAGRRPLEGGALRDTPRGRSTLEASWFVRPVPQCRFSAVSASCSRR